MKRKGLFLAIPIALSLTACSGGQTENVPVSGTVAFETSATEETEAESVEDNQPIGLPTPWDNYDSLEALELSEGENVVVPDTIEDIKISDFRYLKSDKIVEIGYVDPVGTSGVIVRRAPISDTYLIYSPHDEALNDVKGCKYDISGVYDEYNEEIDSTDGDKIITLRNSRGNIVNAIWNDSTYCYSMTFTDLDVSADEALDLISKIS